MQRTGHRSVNGVRAYKRGSEKLSQLTTSILNRNEKKAKVEEGMKTEGSENVQPAEVVKPRLLHAVTTNYALEFWWNISVHYSTLQDNIPFNCHYSAASYCVYVS